MIDQRPLSRRSLRTLDELLDAALADSFPASDPIAILVDHGVPARPPSPATPPISYPQR